MYNSAQQPQSNLPHVPLALPQTLQQLQRLRTLLLFSVFAGHIGLFTSKTQQCSAAAISPPMTDWRLIERAEWMARAPVERNTFAGPAPYVILHHSFQPGMCHTENDCKAAMLAMQTSHIDGRGWSDIGYSFAVGGDGNVYEGRGYEVVGAHAPLYNNRSIGLLLVGDFREQLPTPQMLQVAQDFIEHSVASGKLREDYALFGHRQVRNGTECPGDALYAEIQSWQHWQQEVPIVAYPMAANLAP